jgi:hypothetical protein
MLPCVSRALQGLVVGVLGLLLLGLVVPDARAQGPESIGLDEIEKETFKAEYRALIPKLIKGDVVADPNNAEHQKAIDLQARYLLFRFHYDDFHDPMSKTGKTIDRLYRDFELDLSQLSKYGAKLKDTTWPMYTRSMINYGKLVLQSPATKPITRINVARCMARLPELEQPELIDFYTEMLTDPAQSDAVKYYMLRGLGDLLANEKASPNIKPSYREKAASALLTMAQSSRKFLPSTSPAEIEGFRVLRREAIRALGATRLPSVPNKGRPALELLKVMEGEGLNPEAKMDERIEAAIGLGRLLPDLDKDYCPDFAAQQIGGFVDTFKSFALDANGGNKVAKLPCKIYAARLQESLEALDAASGKQPQPVKDYVTSVSKTAYPVLGLLQKDSPSGNQVNTFAAALAKVVEKGGPNKQLFKGLPESPKGEK